MCSGISEVRKLLGLDRHAIYTKSICEFSYYVHFLIIVTIK